MSVDSLTAADELRPTTFDGYIGQERMKAELTVRVNSALKRGAMLPHTLLLGPAGAGKTTLATILGGMLFSEVTTFKCPLSREDYRVMRNAPPFLFLDEIHAATPSQKEDFQCMLENNYMRPKGVGLMEWENLTVVSASTLPGKIPKPLRDRFLIQPFYEDYSDEEMAAIGKGMAAKLGIEMTDSDYLVLGGASAGTPRKLSHFMTAARDLTEVYKNTPSAEEVLAFIRHTPDGLDPNHVLYLKTLYRQSPLGLSGIRQIVDMDDAGIVELERLLIKLEYIEKTGKGRELSTKGFRRVKELLNK